MLALDNPVADIKKSNSWYHILDCHFVKRAKSKDYVLQT